MENISTGKGIECNSVCTFDMFFLFVLENPIDITEVICISTQNVFIHLRPCFEIHIPEASNKNKGHCITMGLLGKTKPGVER